MSDELAAIIRAEIASGGPITFARYMELALLHPRFGYYRSQADRPTREGDFLTAPELHPVFARTLARQVAECWDRLGRPATWTVREYGAGSGTLGLGILRGMELDGVAAGNVRYEPVELNEHRRAAIRDRFAGAGMAGRLERSAWPGTDPGLSTRLVGCVVANEFLDALPVHRVVATAGRLEELYVTVDGDAFVEVAGEPSDPRIAARLEDEGVRLGNGQRAEICLQVDEWMREVAGTLERGYVLLIDYGHEASRLYDSSRPGGTLLTYAGHRVGPDPFASVGDVDLTAHVDFTAVRRAARQNRLIELGYTTQAEFLVGAGLEDLVEEVRSNPATSIEEYLALRGSLRRLLDPTIMGGFRVLGLGRGVEAEPPLRGFAFKGPRS